MKNNYLPFQIGEQYENWEFDLDYVEEEKIKGFDSYIYLWSTTFLHLKAKQAELIFCLDILEVVILTFEFENIDKLNQARVIIKDVFKHSIKQQNQNLQTEIFQMQGNLEMRLKPNLMEYGFDIVYGLERYVNILFNES